MKRRQLHVAGRVPAALLAALTLPGCLVGRVMDTAGNPLTDLEVVAIGNCSGAGCAAIQTQVTVGNEQYTGYLSSTNANGYYMYDPYAYHGAPEEAVVVHAPAESDGSVQFLFSSSGYQDVLLRHVPDYQEHVDPNTGDTYVIAQVPAIYLCRDDEVDSDGDTICDEAEKQYGTSHGNVDTDNDGVNDNVELFEAGTDPGDLQQCVFAYCTGDVIACTNDPECTGWLTCMEGCGDDVMLCPTECGAFYQSPVIDSLSTCALDNACAFVEFPDLPECQLPAADRVPVGNIDGVWWVTAIKGYDYVLYDDCQKFDFTELNETQIQVLGSHPITIDGETRIAENTGLFTRSTEGYLELAYDNWQGYRERYNPYHATSDVMVTHVCSVGTDDICRDYGTLVLTRTPLADLSAEESAGLDYALQDVFQETLADYTLIGTDSCPNE